MKLGLFEVGRDEIVVFAVASLWGRKHDSRTISLLIHRHLVHCHFKSRIFKDSQESPFNQKSFPTLQIITVEYVQYILYLL